MDSAWLIGGSESTLLLLASQLQSMSCQADFHVNFIMTNSTLAHQQSIIRIVYQPSYGNFVYNKVCINFCAQQYCRFNTLYRCTQCTSIQSASICPQHPEKARMQSINCHQSTLFISCLRTSIIIQFEVYVYHLAPPHNSKLNPEILYH